METKSTTGSSRREFLKNTGVVAAASALAGMTVPAVHAGENNTIQLALVGCGGRGTGAAGQALSVKNGPIKLVAMGDLFADRLKSSYQSLAAHTATKSTCLRIANSSASTLTKTRWIV